jgi:hypothetical protein
MNSDDVQDEADMASRRVILGQRRGFDAPCACVAITVPLSVDGAFPFRRHKIENNSVDL